MSDPKREDVEATGLARRAVDLGRDDAEALSYSGYVLGYVAGDLDDAAAFIDRALTLNTNLAAAWGFSGWTRMCFGDPETAIKHTATAMRLSPLDPYQFVWQGITALAQVCAGRYDEATAWAERALREQPNIAPSLRAAATSHALAGRIVEAEKFMARLRQIDPGLRLSNIEEVLPPFRRSDDRARFVDGLRMAGLPT